MRVLLFEVTFGRLHGDKAPLRALTLVRNGGIIASVAVRRPDLRLVAILGVFVVAAIGDVAMADEGSGVWVKFALGAAVGILLAFP